MKKWFLSLVLLVVTMSGVLASGIRLVQFQYLEKLPAYESDLNFIVQNLYYLENWVYDDYWDCPYSKEELRQKMRITYQHLEANAEPENQDWLLLKAIVSSYLYNLDEPAMFQKTVDNFMAIDTLEDRDYRYRWLLADFYSNAAKPFEAWENFQIVSTKIPAEYLHPDFFWDKAMFEHAYGMLQNAVHDFETYYSMTGSHPDEKSIYNVAVQNLKHYAGETVRVNDYLITQDRKDGTAYYSSLLGLVFQIPESWGTDWEWMFYPVADGSVTIRFKFSSYDPKVSDTVTYNIMVMGQLDTVSDRFYSYKNAPPADLGLDADYECHNLSSSETYKDLGGSCVYTAYVKTPYDADRILESEAPAQYTGEQGGMNYFRIRQQYARYDKDIHWMILLDSCQDLKDEATQRYVDFLETLILR